jgi:hypothetical protein
LHIAAALGALEAELARIREGKAQTARDPDLALSLPGVEDSFDETERNLSHMKRSIERILPKERRTALGFFTEASPQ